MARIQKWTPHRSGGVIWLPAEAKRHLGLRRGDRIVLNLRAPGLLTIKRLDEQLLQDEGPPPSPSGPNR